MYNSTVTLTHPFKSMPDGSNGGIEYKLTMERRLSKVEAILTEVKDNHLPHLEQKMNWIMLMLITALVSILGDIISRISFH